ncbi:MAG: hypothetical protein K2N06_04075 [Oscillospiraceae bacterium]|nr:hypothetical protein [Oscillospiraceae bacterium]
MNLFDVINNNFFNPLSGESNNRIYSDVLLKIYDLFEHEVSYKISRQAIKDTVLGYLRDEHIDPAEEYKTTDNYASAILRKLAESRWIEEETDSTTYERQITMTDNGIALAEFLQRLIKPPKEEYSSYIYVIYNTLNNREQWENDPYVFALKEVHKNAKRLANSLKKLSTSIRSIIEKTVKEETLQSLTDNLISYCDGDFIKEYSRLVKQQNVHIYRTRIHEMLTEIKSDKYYESIVAGCYCEEDLSDENDAVETVDKMFSATSRFLSDDYDKIMSDIKHKINVYLTLAIGRARFLLNHDEDMGGYVEQTMKFLIEEFGEDPDMELPLDSDVLFNFYTQTHIDKKSLSSPKSRRMIERAEATDDVELSEDDINRAREEQLKEALDPYSKDKMKKYVFTLMGNKQQISAVDIPMIRHEDLLAAVSAAAYAVQNGFDIEVRDGFIENGKFAIHDFVISRK